ncbi:hypothetical protein MRB53_041899 [Persea americana]|nr:hypothetical protein MRB53_041899 [Persea americana]
MAHYAIQVLHALRDHYVPVVSGFQHAVFSPALFQLDDMDCASELCAVVSAHLEEWASIPGHLRLELLRNGNAHHAFWSTVQQYAARVLSGLIIIGMYWGNAYWSSYMPINSNESFDNTGNIYNVTRILDGKGGVDVAAYKEYGPPYFSGANVFGQGAWFAFYPLNLFYVFITHWEALWDSAKDMYRAMRYGEHSIRSKEDSHARMMRKYSEAPEWWFFTVLVLSLVIGIVALTRWPTNTPVWSLFAVVGISFVFLIPTVLVWAVANLQIGTGVLFQLLAGYWFVGNPEATIIVLRHWWIDGRTDRHVRVQLENGALRQSPSSSSLPCPSPISHP